MREIVHKDGSWIKVNTANGGKGDAPRPLSVPFEEFDKNFETIFGKRERQTEPIPFAGMIDIEEDNPPPNA